MTISTATLLGLFALLGVCVVCLASVLISLINARIRIEQERTERAYHLKEAERVRLEEARYAVGLAEERRVLAQWHVPGAQDGRR
jgi:predicted RND superfamily exporter protein